MNVYPTRSAHDSGFCKIEISILNFLEYCKRFLRILGKLMIEKTETKQIIIFVNVLFFVQLCAV